MFYLSVFKCFRIQTSCKYFMKCYQQAVVFELLWETRFWGFHLCCCCSKSTVMSYGKSHFEKLHTAKPEIKPSMEWHEMATGQHKSEKNLLTKYLCDELTSKDFRFSLALRNLVKQSNECCCAFHLQNVLQRLSL